MSAQQLGRKRETGTPDASPFLTVALPEHPLLVKANLGHPLSVDSFSIFLRNYVQEVSNPQSSACRIRGVVHDGVLRDHQADMLATTVSRGI